MACVSVIVVVILISFIVIIPTTTTIVFIIITILYTSHVSLLPAAGPPNLLSKRVDFAA